VLTPACRTALVEWAARTRGLIVEDDYDAEFRYDRTPIGAVQGLDPRRVAHVGSTSKTFAPGLRLGWISAPAEMVGDLQARKSATDSGSPAVDQLALADRGLLLGFGRLPEHKIPLAVDALWSVLNEAGATPSPGRPRRAPDS
jgi:GntR family transcriptional regulator / MocR family aminotransferase